MKYSHADIITLSSVWLKRQGWPVVATDIVNGMSETPDAIAFKTGQSVLIEAKVSRADFIADRKKRFRRQPCEGVGGLRYYAAPPGMITARELPDGWGLMEPNHRGTNLKEVVKSDTHSPRNYRAEQAILVSLLRRVCLVNPECIAVSSYTINTPAKTTLSITPPPPANTDKKEGE